MANITKHLTSISFDSRSGPSPGRRLLALVLVVMLALGSTFPGFALAGEADSEGEGPTPPVEVPVAPDFDPGGEEEGLEDAPASGGEEGGAVEVEPEVDLEVPPVDEVTGAATQAPSEPPPSPPIESPEPAPAATEPEPVQQKAPEPAVSEPVANQSIVAPKQRSADGHTAAGSAASTEAAPPPVEPVEEEAPSPAPQPVAATVAEPGRSLVGKDVYVVQPGDCLWHIATALLPAGAGTPAIAQEVERLWRLNEERIGTGDPSLIYSGTELRLR